MSIGNIVDQVVKSVSEHGGDAGQNLARTISNNPVPVILTGVGLAWLMASGAGRRASDEDDMRDADPYYGAPYRSGQPSHALETREDLTPAPVGSPDPLAKPAGLESDSDDKRDLSERLMEGVRDAKHSAADGLGRAAEAVGSAGRGAMEAGSKVREGASRGGRQARQGMDRLMEEQPLVVGALAFAAGAALGGTLPRTETEDELLGAHSDRLGEKAKRVGGAVAREAEAIGREAVGSADREAPSTTELAEAVKQKVGEASTRLRAAGEAELRSQKGERSVDPAGERPGLPADPKARTS